MPLPDDDDAYMHQYLAQTDLTALDLQDIDLEADAHAERAWQWARLAGAACAAAAVAWCMGTDFYQFHGQGTALVPLAWACLLLALVAAGREAYALRPTPPMGVRNAATLRSRPRRGPPRWPKISAAAQRTLLLFAALSLGGWVWVGASHEAQWQGNGYASSWFGAVGAAIVAGICFGRWLIAQADAAPAPGPRRPPFVWPVWTKWATLSLLLTGALYATLGHLVVGDNEGPTAGFARSGIGLSVGILGAIWIARRFDEWEQAMRRAQHRREPPNLP
jgi:hypothetical protein